MKYIFESRIDIPDPDPETEFTESIKTGIDSEEAPNYAMFILGIGVFIIILYVIILIIKAIKDKKDKEKSKEDNKKNKE